MRVKVFLSLLSLSSSPTIQINGGLIITLGSKSFITLLLDEFKSLFSTGKTFKQSMLQTLIAMDWFSWISKTNIDPSLVHDYAIVFFHNELEEDDICYFNHEFLLSMGISVAKHRLEILKLAKKEKHRITRSRPIIWFLKQTKNYLAHRIRVHNRHDDSAISLAPGHRSYSSRWRSAMLKSNRKFMEAAAKQQGRPKLTYEGNGYKDDTTPVESGQAILMLTNGSPAKDSPYLSNSFSSSNFPEHYRVNCAADGEYLANDVESMRWESMFQDLKPT